jgi:hypothetical protein
MTATDLIDDVLILEDASEQPSTATQLAPSKLGNLHAVPPTEPYQRISFSSSSDIIRLKPLA